MYLCDSKRFPSPKELHAKYGVKFYVKHIHDGNDPDGDDRRNLTRGRKRFVDSITGELLTPRYISYCEIRDSKGNEILAYGESICGVGDTENRQLGHKICVGRAIRDFMDVSNNEAYRVRTEVDKQMKV